jgi:nucleotide-binding universal stress UspA family protein
MSIVRPAVLAAVDGTMADDITVEWAVHEALMRALPLSRGGGTGTARTGGGAAGQSGPGRPRARPRFRAAFRHVSRGARIGRHPCDCACAVPGHRRARFSRWRTDDRAQYRTVVVGVDGSEISVSAIGFAFDEASRRMRGLTAVHAFAPLPEAWTIDEHKSAEYGRTAALVLAESLAGWSEQ